MKEKKTLLIVALALVLLMGGAYVLYGQLSRGAEHNQLGGNTQPPESAAPSGEGTQAPEPQLAPDFTVYDGNGGTVNLSDFRGNRWCSTSGPAGAGPAAKSCRTLTRPARSWLERCSS